MNYLSIMERVARILKMKSLAYKLIYPLYRAGYSRRYTVSGALACLHALSPDRGGSCVRANDISDSPAFDVRVIVPVYNAGKYVNECVDSILAQRTRHSFLVVIVNDGSTDASPELLKKYAALDNVVVIDQDNRGHGGARNRALEHIDARYVMFVDADDCLPADAVEKLMSAADATGADIVSGGFVHFRDNIRIYERTGGDGYVDPMALDGVPWGKVFKAGLFRDVRFPEGYWFEDTVNKLIVYPRVGSAYSVPDIVYRWRRNGDSISRVFRGNPKTIDTCYVTARLTDDARSLGIPVKEPAYVSALLEQFCVNVSRIQTLGDMNAQAAHFEVCRHLLESVGGVSDPEALSPRARKMYRAIAAADVKAFLLTGLFT